MSESVGRITTGPVRQAARSLIAVAANLAGVIGFALVFVVANGGYVWREDCLTDNGRVETAWSYRIWQVIPYLAPAQSGCTYYSGTRALVSLTGVWAIPDTDAPGSASASQATDRFVAGAASALDDVSVAWRRLVSLAALTRSFPREQALDKTFEGLGVFDRSLIGIEKRLSVLPPPGDRGLVEMRTILLRWLRLQRSLDASFVSGFLNGASASELTESTRGITTQLAETRAELLRMRPGLTERYPVLDDWEFLELLTS